MALSLYSNWATLENPTFDMNHFNEHPSEVAEALAGFCEPFESSHLLIDSLFDHQQTEVVNTPISYHHLSLSEPAVLSLPNELCQPSDGTEFYQSRKRPRSCGDLYHRPDLMFEANSYFNGAPSTPPMMSSNFKLQTELPQDFMVLPPVVSGLSECNSEKKPGGGGCLSAQSVAARERRKKISEKTQELGRLIPGGNKMNTAEMFQAAYKYVKFLQSQVGILGLLGSNKRYKASEEMQEKIQVILSSPTIQEKLSGEGKCLVPKVMVEALAEDKEIKSNITISRELDRFIESLG